MVRVERDRLSVVGVAEAKIGVVVVCVLGVLRRAVCVCVEGESLGVGGWVCVVGWVAGWMFHLQSHKTQTHRQDRHTVLYLASPTQA